MLVQEEEEEEDEKDEREVGGVEEDGEEEASTRLANKQQGGGSKTVICHGAAVSSTAVVALVKLPKGAERCRRAANAAERWRVFASTRESAEREDCTARTARLRSTRRWRR